MNTGKLVFSQIMEHMPLWEFRKCVKRYRGNYKIKSFSCLDQFLCMVFAQVLIHQTRDLYSNEDFGVELDNTVYALNSTTIELCLSLFSWAGYCKTQAGV